FQQRADDRRPHSASARQAGPAARARSGDYLGARDRLSHYRGRDGDDRRLTSPISVTHWPDDAVHGRLWRSATLRPPATEPQGMANRSGSTLRIVQALAVASQFGITLVVSVVLGFLAGQWLDGRLNTAYIFTLIGVLVGLAGATVGGVQLYKAAL